ncbi:MAG: sugar phosphate isomerase/epimerase family protein [Armatimonadota bacterium]|nr:sugar phosphate isomerase/epimerase family protein [Armatimonadota bacterium]
MSFSTPNLTFEEILDTAVAYGYDGVEPRLDSNHAHGVEVSATQEQRRRIRELAQRKRIAIACLATSVRYADPEKTQEMITQTHERIDLAGDVGAPVIRVFGGRIPEGVTRDQAIEVVSDSLQKVADHAAERGVVICLETHDDWCDPAHVAAVLSRVNHPAVAANWDVMHPVKRAGVSIDSAFHTLKPWIKHLHIHDGNDSGLVPIGQGDIDHRRVVELLKSIDYSGFLSGEWINWEPAEVHLPRELATMKSYE